LKLFLSSVIFHLKKHYLLLTKSYLGYVLVQKEGTIEKLDFFFAFIVQRESEKQKGSIYHTIFHALDYVYNKKISELTHSLSFSATFSIAKSIMVDLEPRDFMGYLKGRSKN